MAQFPLLPLQEVLRDSAEGHRECRERMRRCQSELAEMRAATEAAISESQALMRHADLLLYAPPKGWLKADDLPTHKVKGR